LWREEVLLRRARALPRDVVIYGLSRKPIVRKCGSANRSAYLDITALEFRAHPDLRAAGTPSMPMLPSAASELDLIALVDGRSDAELDAALRGQVDTLLDSVFAGLCQRYRSERARGERALIQWRLGTPDGPRLRQLQLSAEGCNSVTEASAPSASIEAELPTFLRVMCGRLNALSALATGALRVSGDSAVAVRLQLWFCTDLSRATLDVSTPQELGRLVSGRSDAELAAGVAVANLNRTLDQVLNGMVGHYLPKKGPGRRAVIEFKVHTDEGPRVYQFVAEPRRPSWHLGAREDAKVKVEIGLPDLLRLVSGRLDGMKGLAQRKLKVRGNLFMASGIQGWFDLSR
jgi:putative sterol carrier protein